MTLPNKKRLKQIEDVTIAAQIASALAILNIVDLADVEITSLTNGQILKWDSTAEAWVNAADAT